MSGGAWQLPALVPFDGDWERYVDAIHERYERDVKAARFFGLRVGRPLKPIVQGKPEGFWHVTSSTDGDDRIPDLRRCERIGWIRAMIDAAGTNSVRCWQNRRPGARGGTSVLLALPDFSYVVVLRKRQGSQGLPYMVLVTAYETRSRRAAQLRREYESFGPYVP